MPMPANAEALPPPRRSRRGRAVWAVAGGAAAIAMVAIVAARWTPGWYAERLAAGAAAGADRDARRLVTAVAGLRDAAMRPGEWGAAVREQEINAWLATDLPRNHAAMLPAGFAEPRVRLESGRIHLAARAAAGPLAGLVAFDVETRLRAVNQLECSVIGARLGAIPLPAGPFVHRLASVLRGLGFTADIRRLDGRTVVVVSLGGHGAVLEGLSLGSGELVVAGTTVEGR
jgi:hypothetical protein